MMQAESVFGRLRSRKSSEVDPDQENWLVSYADLITLLFIFFSIMLSISSVSKAKLELLSHEFNQEALTSLSDLKKKLDKEIQNQNLQAEVSTQMSDAGLHVQFNERVLFASGEAVISAEGTRILELFSKILSKMDGQFKLAVEGHTDSVPIHTEKFSSNWALSSSRAVHVLHFLKENGLDEKRMMIHAFADTRPMSPTSPEQKSVGADPKNRRVTLLVF